MCKLINAKIKLLLHWCQGIKFLSSLSAHECADVHCFYLVNPLNPVIIIQILLTGLHTIH